MKIIAVIPAFNESKRIEPVIKKTKRFVDEVIVVDDHSRDNTYETAKKAGAKAIRLISNMGAGFATRVGCDLAMKNRADIIITLDADGQHDPEEIPKLLKTLQEYNLDIVFGSRPRNENMPKIRRLGNWGLSFIAKILFNSKVKDTQTGYHAFTSKAYPMIRWSSSRYGVVTEFAVNVAKNGLRCKEVEVKTIYVDKNFGMRKRDAVRATISMLKWRIKK
nr:glycosyltransferase family 2 protein [Candidatus Woesearchaeota archaeon]